MKLKAVDVDISEVPTIIQGYWTYRKPGTPIHTIKLISEYDPEVPDAQVWILGDKKDHIIYLSLITHNGNIMARELTDAEVEFIETGELPQEVKEQYEKGQQ